MELSKHPPERKIENYEYSTKAHLGSGAFGKVYLGRESSNTKKLVAIKVMAQATMKDEYLHQALKNEIDIMKKLKSNNTVQFLDVHFTKNNIYIITEFCKDGDLRSIMTKKKGPMSEAEALSILKDIINGFKELEKNAVIHRDLKPENILCNDGIFKLADFGFSKKMDNFQMDVLQSAVGTPLYMSPQILKSESYTSKSDVWSMAIILYEMICGKTPWPARSQYELVKKIEEEKNGVKFPYNINISENCRSFIKSCLEPKEENRLSWQDVFSHTLLNSPAPRPSVELKQPPKSLAPQLLAVIQNLQKAVIQYGVEIEKLYKGLDRTGDGVLELDEFKTLLQVIDKQLPESAIVSIFEYFDKNGDKTLSFDEFKILMFETDYVPYKANVDPFLHKKAGNVLKGLREVINQHKINIEQLFTVFDKGKKQTLTIENFRDMLRLIDKEITDKEAEYVFSQVDSDKSGTIDISEFMMCIGIKGEDKSSKANTVIKQLRDIINKNNLNITQIFRNFDVNKTGELSYDEFKEIIKIIDKNLGDDYIKIIFDFFDNDKSNSVNLIEFKTVMEQK